MTIWNDASAAEEGIGEAFEDMPTGVTTIYVNGSYIDVEPGSPFAETVLQTARNANMGKFRVFDAVGNEIEQDGAPENFSEGMKIELRPYDEAA